MLLNARFCASLALAVLTAIAGCDSDPNDQTASTTSSSTVPVFPNDPLVLSELMIGAPEDFGGMRARFDRETAREQPPYWTPVFVAGLPTGTLLGSVVSEPLSRTTPPRMWLKLRTSDKDLNLPAGSIIGFDGSTNPDDVKYEVMAGPPSQYATINFAILGVHEIPPRLAIGQEKKTRFAWWRLQKTSKPKYWKHVTHPWKPGCQIPPNPVYATHRRSADSPPTHWFIRKEAGAGFPKGAMFGSRTDKLPDGLGDIFRVEKYGDVTPVRWLRRWRPFP